MFQDLDCNSECILLDEFGIWSNFVEIFGFVKAGLVSSVTYPYDLKRHQNSKIKYFDAAFSNVPDIENISAEKSYEQNTQWVRERRKYPNEEPFTLRKLVLVYHLLGSIGQNPFSNMNRN